MKELLLGLLGISVIALTIALLHITRIRPVQPPPKKPRPEPDDWIFTYDDRN